MFRFFVSALFAAAATAAIPAPRVPEPAVNTFIGTQDEGNTFPGASAPFGLIQVSPIGSHYAGWQYGESFKDLLLTMSVPTLLMVATRLRPDLFRGGVGRRRR